MLFLALFVGVSFAGAPSKPTELPSTTFCARALEASSVIRDLYSDLDRVDKLKQKEIRYLRGRFKVPYLQDEGVMAFYRNLLFRAVGWLQMGHIIEALPLVEGLRTSSDFESFPEEWKSLTPLVSGKEWDPNFLTKIDGDFLLSIATQPRYFPQNVRQLQAQAFVYEAYKSTWGAGRRPTGFAKAAQAVLVAAGFSHENATQYWQSIQHDGLISEFAFQIKEIDGNKVKTCCGQGCLEYCPKNVLARAYNTQNRQDGVPKFPILEGPPPPTLLLFKHFPNPEVTDGVKPEWLPFLQRQVAKEGRSEAAQHDDPAEDVTQGNAQHDQWLEDLGARDAALTRQIDARSSAWRAENPELEAQAQRIDKAARRYGAAGVNYAAGVKNVLTSLIVTLNSILAARGESQNGEPTIRIEIRTGATTITPEVNGLPGANRFDFLQHLTGYGLQSGLGEGAAVAVASALLRDIAARNISVGDLRVDTDGQGVLTIRLAESRL